jgi:acetyltransferase-like isoleucine patch superfamily enzyme
MDDSRSPLGRYQRVVVGSNDLWYTFKFELLTCLLSSFPGALGLALRAKLWPTLFAHVGRGTVFGRNVSLSHPRKISLGDGVVVADGVVLDARGDRNEGITIGSNCVIGREVVISCKEGSIRIGERAQISHGAILSAVRGNRLEFGDHVLIAPQVYVGGGSYHTESIDTPIALQGNDPKGGSCVGSGAWLGTRAIILDGVDIGAHAIVGAGSVVTHSVPSFGVAVGVPARVIRSRSENGSAGAAEAQPLGVALDSAETSTNGSTAVPGRS